jgi:phage terminase small subunit
MAANKLSPKQSRFAKEYLIDLNATQAAIRAGYSPKTANEQACRLLAKVSIQEAVANGQRKIEQKLDITAEWVLKNLKEVAQRCMQHVPVMVFDREEKRRVQATNEDGEGVYEFDSSGANRSLELIGKHLGMFIDRTQIISDAEPTKVIIEVQDARRTS